MDILQEYTPLILSTLSTIEPYTRAPLRTLTTIYNQTSPILLPYVNSLLRTLHTSPAILSLAALLLLLILALQILSFIRRVMMFWMRLVVRLVFWAVIVGVVALVWQRGLERTVGDLGRWACEVQSVWEGEYRRWEGVGNAGGGNGGKGVYGNGRGSAFGGRGGRTNAGSAWR